MLLAEVGAKKGIAFLSSENDMKVDEIREHPEVNVSFVRESVFASISGTARIEKDPSRAKTLWRDEFGEYFSDKAPQGDLVIIQVEPDYGEFWDLNAFGSVKQVYETSKAVLSGSPLPQENRKVAL